MNLKESDISWVVVKDGDVVYESDTKNEALQWVEKEEMTPDRVASKVSLKGGIWL